MAFIGLRHPVAAKLLRHEDGQAPVYGAGRVIGRLIQHNASRSHSDTPLYADDIIDEFDNSVTAVNLTVGVNDISDDDRRLLLGDTATSEIDMRTGDVTAVYDEGGDGGAPVGFGFIRVRRKNSVDSYVASWYWSVVFSEDSEESQTKGEAIEWKTPTINGRGRGLYIDESGAPSFRRRKCFDTMAEAVAWLHDMAGMIPEENTLAALYGNMSGLAGGDFPDFHPQQLEYDATINTTSETDYLHFNWLKRAGQITRPGNFGIENNTAGASRKTYGGSGDGGFYQLYLGDGGVETPNGIVGHVDLTIPVERNGEVVSTYTLHITRTYNPA